MSAIKRAIVKTALAHGHVVKVTCMVVPGLDLPDAVRADGVTLDYGDDMPNPIPDLEVGDAGISATLSFARTPIKTFVPWSAVARIYVAGDVVALFPVDVGALVGEPPKKPTLTVVV